MSKYIRAIQKRIKDSSIIDDKEALIEIDVLNKRMEITPRTMSVEQFHLKTIQKLRKRRIDRRVLCFISEDGKKVIMQGI